MNHSTSTGNRIRNRPDDGSIQRVLLALLLALLGVSDGEGLLLWSPRSHELTDVVLEGFTGLSGFEGHSLIS